MVTTRCYNVHVDEEAAKASASWIAFVHQLGDQHRAAEFRLAGSTFDDSGLSISSSRQPTFREQFRVSGEAHDTFPGNEADDERFIKGKMREAFWSGVAVEVMFIAPAPNLGR
jgi:hypothetical protein